MNRTQLLLLSLASIFFLFGSLVVAESGSGSNDSDDAEKALKELKKQEMKVKLISAKPIFGVESIEEARLRIEARAEDAEDALDDDKVELRIRGTATVPEWANDVKAILAAFDIDAATLEKLSKMSSEERERALRELRIRYELKENSEEKTELRLRMKAIADRASEVAAAHKLEGSAKFKARLEVAIKIAEENGNTELVAKLKALAARLAAKTTLSAADEELVHDALFDNRKADFEEKAPKAIQLSIRVNNGLNTFIAKLETLIDGRAEGGLNTSRLEAGLGLLNKVEDRLAEQIAQTQDDWEAYEANPSQETLKVVHYDLVKLKVLARHAVQDMRTMVRFYKHFTETKGADSDSYAEYEVELEDEVETEAEADVAAADVVGGVDVTLTINTTDDNPSADDIAGETDDSGMDSAEDIAENTTGGTA